MPLFRITTKMRKYTHEACLEKGMTVEVSTMSLCNPLYTNGGQCVIDAFHRIYGIDIKKMGALSTVYLDVKRID